MSNPDREERHSIRPYLVIAIGCLILAGAIAYLDASLTAPTRNSVRTYTALIDAANRGDLADVRALCTSRYLKTHPLRLADEGGVVGLPRGIHKNFQVWRRGDDVWLCPTNRIGPVYRFVEQTGSWKFDGLAGYLRPRNVFVPAEEPGPGSEEGRIQDDE